MINKIITGISQALNSAFDEAYTNYTDEVEQDLSTPCFIINAGASGQNQVVGIRYKNDNGFIIQCIPKINSNEFLNDVKNKLFDCLEYITVDGKLFRGIEMEGNVTDYVLTFTVNYNMHVIKPVTPVDSMGILSVKGSVK